MRAVTLLLLALALPAAAGCTAIEAILDGDQQPRPVTYPAIEFATSLGTFTAILFPEDAPESVAFIQELVAEGYYDGREFNRIIPGFVIQEVDRFGGATDQTRTVRLENSTRVHFSMGALGIARGEDVNSGGSEFFVMDFAHAHLYGNYTAFGQVITGMDVVHDIARVDAASTSPVTGPLGSLPLPPAPVGLHDRIAIVPASITTAKNVEVALPYASAVQFPRIVGERTVVDEPPTRYTPEWPRNLGVGNASAMTWYVYTAADGEMPDLSGALARITTPSGATLDARLTPDPIDGRILHWTWTPTEAGPHTLALHIDEKEVATATANVLE